MASPVNAALCAGIACAFWTLLGYGVARHLLPRTLGAGAAPLIGWAVHSAVLLPIVVWTGFSPTIVVLIGVLCMLLVGLSLSLPAPASDPEPIPAIPPWTFAVAAIL